MNQKENKIVFSALYQQNKRHEFLSAIDCFLMLFLPTPRVQDNTSA